MKLMEYVTLVQMVNTELFKIEENILLKSEGKNSETVSLLTSLRQPKSFFLGGALLVSLAERFGASPKVYYSHGRTIKSCSMKWTRFEKM